MATGSTITDQTGRLDAERLLDFREYAAWLAKHGVTNLEALKNHYEVLTRELATEFESSAFWRTALQELKNVDAEYQIKHKYPLISDFTPMVFCKPWDSFLKKSYRKNIAANPNFPNSPDGGWYLPPNPDISR
jgi:hypothetical protein